MCRYKDRIGCSSVDLTNAQNVYARFTKSVLCSRLVQQSKACNNPAVEAPVLCASSCVRSKSVRTAGFYTNFLKADWAQSEQIIAADNNVCGSPFANAMETVKSDFVICSVDSGSAALSDKCVHGATNEPNNCGFGYVVSGMFPRAR